MATQAYNIQAADAQAKLPNNSVRSETIVNGQVLTQDIGDGTIQEQDIADGVIPSDGGAIQLNPHIVRTGLIEVQPDHEVFQNVDCPSGEIVISGGFNVFGEIEITQSLPLDENSWRVAAVNRGTLNAFEGYALCIDPSP